MTANIVLAILVTSLATYISRFLGALTSEKIGETSKIYKWFNCVAYSTLAALISRILIFPSGDLSDVHYILTVSYTHPPSPRDVHLSRMPSSA